MLAGSPVGSWIRTDASSWGLDMRAEIYTGAEAGNAAPDSEYTWEEHDTLLREYTDAVSSGDGYGYAFAKVAGFIIPEIWDGVSPVTGANRTAVPSVSMESVQLGNAYQGGMGGGLSVSYPYGEIGGRFIFDDSNPSIAKKFYGALYLIGLGVATGSGLNSSAYLDQGADITIHKNGQSVGRITFESFADVYHNYYENVNETSGILTVAIDGREPYTLATTGANIFVNFVIDIEDGDVITMGGGVSNSFGAGGEGTAGAGSGGYGASSANYSFIKNVHAHGFAFEADSPPDDLPPIWDGNADGVGNGSTNSNLGLFSNSYAPGDLDGNGAIDQLDAELWEQTLVTAAQNGVSPLIVTTEEDLDDGDYSFHDLSLREAIALANDPSYAGARTIVFAKWVDQITLGGSALAVDSSVNIVGPGADKLTVDADGTSRVFYVAGTGVLDVQISGMTIKGGAVNGDGAGIYNASEDLTLHSVVVTDNHATGTGLGGGLFSANGSVTIFSSEFHGNTATRGGGIRVQGFPAVTLNIYGSSIYQNSSSAGEGGISAYSATSYIENTTISENTAGQDTGGVFVESSGVMTIVNSTIVNNTATNYGGGLRKTGGTVTLHNTIVANNQNLSGWGPTLDIHGALDPASSYNILGAGANGQSFSGAGNIIGTPTSRIDPLLAPLGDYGGKTKTHALLTNSPAIDQGSNDWSISYDQRGSGFAREYDLSPTNGGDGFRDIGAFEAGLNTSLVVRNAGDRNNSVALKATTDSLRLREALALATALAGSEIISFDPSLYAGGMATITLSIDGADAGSAPDSLSVANTVISGPGADKLTIAGTSQQSVIVATGTSTISGVTITDGGGLAGGGVYADGIVTIRNSRVVGNTVSNAGGGIFSYGVLRVIGSEVADNTVTGASGAGAGIAIEQYNSLYGFDIINSTISGNTASGASSKGGGVYSFIYDPYLYDYRIINSTITDNSASQGSGVYDTYYQHPAGNGRYLYAGNSIIADNLVGGDVSGNLKTTSANNLLRSGASGGLSTNNILLSGSSTARLKSLEFSSAGTRVHLPYYDSAAIDAGSNSIATNIALELDQRGWDRFENWDGVGGDTVDIGAVELAFSEYYS
ncbi:choice-of-anchor Q domain-containing protein [Lacipirellula parvula]|uniref:choice-of-anchor Q domain-containing protein n=1 Tax=Lacipirellula parvula TaxID=2650471 RepID=UPI001260A1C4|nr:choice-of-anchor Q domain-containing protein [Lacipirellula parvula]